VQEQFVTHANVIGRYDKGQAVVDERDLANESFVQDAVDQPAIIVPRSGLRRTLVFSVGAKLLVVESLMHRD